MKMAKEIYISIGKYKNKFNIIPNSTTYYHIMMTKKHSAIQQSVFHKTSFIFVCCRVSIPPQNTFISMIPQLLF